MDDDDNVVRLPVPVPKTETEPESESEPEAPPPPTHREAAIAAGWLKPEQESPWHWWCDTAEGGEEGIVATLDEGWREVWQRHGPEGEEFDPITSSDWFEDREDVFVISLDDYNSAAGIWEQARKYFEEKARLEAERQSYLDRGMWPEPVEP
jgi:hypothetical protein